MPSKFDFFGSLKSMILKIFCCDGLTAQVLVAIVLLLAFSQNVCTFCQAHSATPSWGLIVTPGATLHGKNPALVECPKVFQTMIKKTFSDPSGPGFFPSTVLITNALNIFQLMAPCLWMNPWPMNPTSFPNTHDAGLWLCGAVRWQRPRECVREGGRLFHGKLRYHLPSGSSTKAKLYGCAYPSRNGVAYEDIFERFFV